MSGYPYGYAFQGGQPPPPPQQQQYPPYQPYAAYPPSFGTAALQLQQAQHYLPPTTNYYANTQSAYDNNAHSIPGLGPSRTPPFPTPRTGTWNQGSYGNVPTQAQFPAYSAPTPNAPTPVSYPIPQAPASTLRTSQAPVQAAQPNKQNKPAAVAQPKPQLTEQLKPLATGAEMQEDGEIDDGYFDDLYDDASKAPSVANDPAVVPDKALGNTVEDASDQEPNFYDTDMEEVSASKNLPSSIRSVENKNSTTFPDRDRSRSYSPHLSPAEPRAHPLPSDTGASNGIAAVNPNAQSSTNAATATSISVPAQDIECQEGKQADVQSVPNAVPGAKAGSTATKSFASISEAHNEAKKAILKLLPHGVKYQTYIDEGFDAGVMKDLFAQLNLPTGPAPSVRVQKATTPQDKENSAAKLQLPEPTPAVDTVAKKQEERKDRIARLLAEKEAQKKAKLAAASNSAEVMPAPTVAKKTTNVVPTPPAKPSVTKAETDRLLQRKVEALRAKARESKKLAQKQVSSPVPNSGSTPTHQAAPTVPQPRIAESAASTPLSSASQSAAASPASSALPSMPRAGAQVNQRKRPVAADFMDYQAPFPKRQSFANREDSSFVISVSDDEEDDDDVEMEVESATEDSPTPLHQPLNLPRRGGPSIRDFPPLKDFPNGRQVSSPVPAMPVSNSKVANADLQSKERAIMEMNRKIKELEAKKQAKIKSGNVTPRSPSVGGFTSTEQGPKPKSPRISNATSTDQALKTPMRGVLSSNDVDDKTTPSAQLLQEAEAANAPTPLPGSVVSDRQSQDEGRIGVPSAQVTGKSAKARERAERLRRMQEEMQRLQAEIDQDEDGDSIDEQGGEQVETRSQDDATGARQGMLASIVDIVDESDRVDQLTPADPAESTGQGEAASNQHSSTDTTSPSESIASDLLPTASGPSNNDTAPSDVSNPLEQLAARTSTVLDTGKLPDALASTIPELRSEDTAVINVDESDDYEPPEPELDRHVNTESPILEPASGEADHTGLPSSAEVAEAVREATGGTGPTQQTSLAPYESPLRYFHAYRFHPNYNDGIQGGLKSLTYSNRIDPKKEMCPDEWDGKDCPRGSACQFQHFQSIIVPDSEIILELGSSDEFSGEKKKEFNSGLRAVVASFQKSKVRDFRTIAGAILDFRRRFLGDDSKVLRLDGVSA